MEKFARIAEVATGKCMRGFANVNACTGPFRASVPVLLDLLTIRNAIQRMIFMVAVAFAITISPIIASAAVNGNCADRPPAAPSLPEFLKAARPANPGVSEEALTHYWTQTYNRCYLFLKGRISPDDVAIFKRSLENTGGNGSLMLILDSEGGDLTTAIEIGRLVRHWPDSLVIVSLDSKCFSSCVFVLAGGLHRVVHGKVGIHRPFNSKTDARTFESTQKTFRALEQSAKSFLKDVNVPTSLYDEMMSVRPEKLRLLTEQELARFGIGQSDPAYQENSDAEAARAYGLDKEEYLRRKERAERICNALNVNEQKVGIEVTLKESAEIVTACKEAVVRTPPLTDKERAIFKDLQRR
jgi:hypothetical protein